MAQHATGPFDVKIAPQQPDSDIEKAANLRRFTARAKGRGNVILKQTCHIHVVVGDGR